ncbi:flagellin [Henriciella sp.]|uniref:flagellin n=1 Tax=Henriciella sp. TaxID=1968823 RepID=UPI0026091355|nr:flagellin [Henriciella sp.]
MSSILTNNSAMVALETLRGINRNLESVQSEISTGKKIASAKDNAAIWAISTTMKTDVDSFKQISDSLNLGASTVGLASKSAEQITGLVQDVQNLIVSAQEENVDRSKIQNDIDTKIDRIKSIVGGSQFNGLNLINGSSTEDVSILASLDRNASGDVNPSYINVERQDLSLSNSATAATFGGTAVTDTTIIDNGGTNAGTADSVAASGTQDITIASVADGNSYRITLDDTAGDNALGSRTFEYVANADDSVNSVAANLSNQIQTYLDATGDENYSVTRDGDTLTVTNGSGGALSIQADSATGGTAGVSAGGLGNLNLIDVTTNDGATSALTTIQGVLDTAISAAAELGSAQKGIEDQAEFVQTITDSLTSGVGALVDSDIEAASAKLQALQVQQQLGTQALSIANSAPQQLLALFR